MPGSGGSAGNSVVILSPGTGVQSGQIPVGSEPGKMALAADGRTLYVGLNGAGAVRMVDLQSGTAGAQFSLGTAPSYGPMFVEDIEVMPGSPQSVAISRRYQGLSPKHAGVAVFDSGIARSTTTPGHTGSNVIEFGSNPQRLYGYNNESTEFGFRRMDITAGGVTTLDSSSGIVGFNADIELQGGRAFSSSGQVLDAESRTLVGTYTDLIGTTTMAVDLAGDRVFFLSQFGPPYRLSVFDASDFTLIGSWEINGVAGRPAALTRWGARGLVFKTDAGEIHFIDAAPGLS